MRKLKPREILKYCLKRIRLFALLLPCILLSPAYAQVEAIPVDKIIVKVDNKILLKSELELAYFNFKRNGQMGSDLTRCDVLEQLVVNKLLLAKADIDSVVVSESRVNEELDRKMSYFIAQFGSKERLESAYDKTVDELKDELRDQLKNSLVVQKMQSSITEGVKVTPAEVRRFYRQIPTDSLPFFSKEVEVGQIVRVAQVGREQKADARQLLLDIKSRILAGEDFGSLAKAYSDDPGSKKSGGELGFRGKGELVPAFEATAMKLQPGQVSDPVESQFGFHLIQLIERRGTEYNSRHILIKPSSGDVNVNEAMHFLDSIRTRVMNDSISFEKAAKELSDDMQTASNGGMFYDQKTNSTKISVEDLDPTVFFTIDTLQPGTITMPMPYRTADNKEASRIIYFKSKTPPHQANLSDDYQKIHHAALEEKRQEAIDKWFKKTRSELYISIDDEYAACDILKKTD